MKNIVSVNKLQEEVEGLQDEREKLEENCDSLPLCEEDSGCAKCDNYKKMAVFDEKIEALEEEIETILGAEEEEEE